MLSKIEFFRNHSERYLNETKAEVDTEALVNFYKKRKIDLSLKAIDGGTLGLTYYAVVNNYKIFFKTHLNAVESRKNLLKEIFLMNACYGDYLSPERIDLPSKIDGGIQTWMSMPFLRANEAGMTPDEIALIVADIALLGEGLKVTQDFGLYSFQDLLERGQFALAFLIEQGYLSDKNILHLKGLLCLIESQLPQFSLTICHGDLGPKNIMIFNESRIAIDWEDAFWGIKGYDYLYWLTFFQNRKYYNRDVLEKSGLSLDTSVAIMCLILVLKSALSIFSKTVSNHTLTVDDRFSEVINLQRAI